MKPTKTRRELHQEMQEQIDQFLAAGGAVNEVARGVSGRPYAHSPLVAIFDGSSGGERTPIPDVVAAIEARKHPVTPAPRTKRPKKRIIYDDFGQPLRWEWIEE